ncbi:MAG: SurA N-terminal domain-containing protein [Bacteroidota bacterium]
MSVIQTIRDRGGLISAILIAISLLGFILMDAFTGRSNMFGGTSTTLGTVNGKKIDYIEFNKRYIAEQDARQKQGYPMDDQGRQQVNESIWNQEVTKILGDEEFEKLGISVGKNEVNDILFGKNPPADLKQGFTDPKTNVYNAEQAKQYFAQMKKSKNATERQQLSAYITSIEYSRMMEKYASLLSNSTNVPKWFVEKQNADNSQLAKISYVKIPYTSVADSSVKVSDAEIADYISKHKDEFKQDDETRGVEYVLFNAGPSHADTLAVKDKMESLKEEFKNTTDIKSFIVKSGSELPFYDGFITGKTIQQTNKDSILANPVGSVYGPYLDGGYFALSKMIATKQQWPDTVKVRHILVGTTQQNQQGQTMTIREDSTAKKLADSIQTAIRNGANFDSLCIKYSDDQGKNDQKTGAYTGGIYDNVTTGRMVPEFNDFIFDHKTGEKGIVKTDFGYHYIEILSQKGNSTAYKIAYISKSIFPSSTTDDSVSNAASQFAGDSRDEKTFEENFEKNLKPKGLNKFLAEDVKPNDFTIGQSLPAASRSLVKAVFAAKKGEVLQPVRVGDSYVVVAVTEVNEAGTQSVSKARSAVEPLLLKKKKADQILQKIGKVNTLEEIATKTNQQVVTVDSLRITGGRNFGFEPRIIGAAFATANKGKVIPEGIEGSEGVFAVKVDEVSATPVENANIDQQRKQLAQNLLQRQGYPTRIWMKAAKIKDNRAKFF